MALELKDIPYLSLGAVKRGDKEGWLALFEDDAVVEDPVGGHPHFDPEGKGQQGKAAIGKFFDLFMTNREWFEFDIHFLSVNGDEVALLVTMTSKYPGMDALPTKAVNVYRRSKNGKVQSLRSFWTQ
jgi:steroid Delta-isomerase